MRIFARRERPHPGAQLILFEAGDGWRYTLWVTNRPASTRGWLGQPAYIDAAHRVHARVEDAIRIGQDGIGKYPSASLAMNKAWQAAALAAATLLAWLKLLALDGTLAKAEPKTLRYRILHAAARLTRGGCQRRLNIQATWPWAADIEQWFVTGTPSGKALVEAAAQVVDDLVDRIRAYLNRRIRRFE
jgi:Transposase DDE domain group 1